MKFYNSKYQAICLDTNVYDRHKCKFETSLLSKLKDLKNSNVTVLVPSVIRKEVERHFSSVFRKNVRSFNETCSDLTGFFNVDEDVVEEFKARLHLDSCERMFESYCRECNAHVVSSEGISVEELIAMYDAQKPPFGSENKGRDSKKHEFPDAIALLSLENWAKKSGVRVLAVSHDVGWQRYAEKSDVLDVVDELSGALDALYAGNVLPNIIEYCSKKAIHDHNIDIQISDYVWGSFFMEDVKVVGRSDFMFEIIDSYAIVSDCMLVLDDDHVASAEVVAFGSGEIEIRYDVLYEATAVITYSLSVRNSIDKDVIELGTYSTEVGFTGSGGAQVNFAGDFDGDLSALSVQVLGVELDFEVVDAGYLGVSGEEYVHEESRSEQLPLF